MKKVKLPVILLVAIVCSAIQFNASAQEFQKGNILINTGISFGYYDAFANAYTGVPIGIGANVEFSITDDIAVGGFLTFTSWSNNWGYAGYDYSYKYNSLDFGARGSYHFSRLLNLREKKFDPYAGALLGLGIRNSSDDFDPNYNDPYDGVVVQPGIFAGARYFFSNNFAAYGEVGIGLHPITLGISFKM